MARVVLHSAGAFAEWRVNSTPGVWGGGGCGGRTNVCVLQKEWGPKCSTFRSPEHSSAKSSGRVPGPRRAFRALSAFLGEKRTEFPLLSGPRAQSRTPRRSRSISRGRKRSTFLRGFDCCRPRKVELRPFCNQNGRSVTGPFDKLHFFSSESLFRCGWGGGGQSPSLGGGGGHSPPPPTIPD